jgi:hypothetical protein
LRRVKRGRDTVAREIDLLRLGSIEVPATGADGKSAAGPSPLTPLARAQELRATGLKSPGHPSDYDPVGGSSKKLIWKTIQHLI